VCAGAKPHEVVFARNATTAINAILRSFPFQSGDGLLCMNFTYNAIKKTLQYLLPKQKVNIVEVEIDSHPTGQQVRFRHKRVRTQRAHTTAVTLCLVRS
jgi:selenocysteine lyase/cysteine desulfurase